MEISRVIVLIFIIFLIFFIKICIRYKLSGIKGIKEYLKNILIAGLCAILILSVYYFLPKHEVGIDIIIKNKNTSAEVYINDDFYTINESVNINNINNMAGFIAVKTENKNKIVYYFNEKSIFKFNGKINVNLKNGNIHITSFFIKISIFVENHKNYDSVLEILTKANETAPN